MQKIADGISEAKTAIDDGWKVVDKWLERRHVEVGDNSNNFKPEDVTVFLLEKEDTKDE